MSEPNPTSQPTPPAAPQPPVPPLPPVPRYGEYAPEGYVPPQIAPGYEQQAPAGYGQPFGAASFPAQPGGRTRKLWDLILTIILLSVGLIGMLIAFGYAALFSDPAMLDQSFQQQGLGGFNGDAGSGPAILVVSHLLIYLIALGGSLPLLITKRVAFWVPLTAGVLAAIVFWATVVGIMLSDPNLIANLS